MGSLRRHAVPHVLPKKIFALTLIPPLLVTATAAVILQVEVGNRMRRHTEEQLSTALLVWADLYESRGEDLITQASVVARDPKFFAMLAQPDLENDEAYRATLRGIADEFSRTLASDYFQILDAEGHTVAGRPDRHGEESPTDAATRAAMQGRTAAATVALEDGLYQIAAVPVVVRNRLVGILRHGTKLDAPLAEEARRLTHCEVTFLQRGVPLATSRIEREETYLAAQAPLASSSEDVSVRLERSTGPEQAFLSHLRLRLLGLGVLVLVLTMLLARWVTRRLSAPVEELVTAAVRLERGEKDLPIEIKTGDELEYLGRRFEEMRGALRDQIRSLQELERMKSTFLSIASHELRTPATIINGAVHILDESAPSLAGGELRKVLETLRGGSDRLERVVRQITDMSLLDRQEMALTMGPFDLRGVLQKITDSWDEMMEERRLELRKEWPEREALPVWGDSARIRQAVSNLVANAIRFTPDGGEILIRAERTDGKLRVLVQDSGIGIPEEERQKIFSRFYEVKNSLSHTSGESKFGTSGLGIGLAITRGIVRAHKGRIWFEPREGGGSRFIIELPALEAPEVFHAVTPVRRADRAA